MMDETIQHTKEAGSASKKVISGCKRSQFRMQKNSVQDAKEVSPE